MARRKIDRKEKLLQLIEKAASDVTLLTNAEEVTELKQFQKVLKDINKEAKAYTDATEDVQVRFKNLSEAAIDKIEQTLKNKIDDASDVIEHLTITVSDLQGLLENNPAEESVQSSEPVSSPEQAQTAAAEFSEEDIPLIQDFITESAEHIESAEGALLELENDPENEEILNQIFRSFHTIKGMAGFLNLSDINVLAHAAENLLDMARKGDLLLTDENCDAVFSSIDLLKNMLNQLEQALSSGQQMQKPGNYDEMIERLHTLTSGTAESSPPTSSEETGSPAPAESSQNEKTSADNLTMPQPMNFSEEDIPLIHDFIVESREHFEVAEAALLNLENDPGNEENLHQIFRSFHTIKGMAGFLNLSDISSLAHAAENLLDMARKGELMLTDANSDAAFASIDMLKGMLTDLEEAITSGSSPARPAQFEQLLATLRKCTQAAQTSTAAGDNETETISSSPADSYADTETDSENEADAETDKKLDTILKNGKTNKRMAASTAADEKIKVSTQRLDDLINMTGELAIAQLMIAEEVKQNAHTDSNLFRKVSLQNKIVRELQELSMSMRMVPIQGAFQRMSRLVRDLSRKAGKTIQFLTSGEETELDRNIVDKITDPLVHMMRNSVDHGIETAQDRSAKGKSPHGRICLSAYHQAGSIVIEIKDDGKGLNRDKIIKKAIEKELISENQELSDEEAWRLIFHPGFSTADKISDVSGRGVGMDVVRKNIESLGGKIDIYSVIDEGTTFTIRLPLTLAIIDGQIVTLNDQRYIIPINTIVNSIRPTQEQISSIQNQAHVVMIRNELMPLIRLHQLFDVENAQQDPTQGLLVIVEEGGHKCCLLVDDLLGQQQVVIKNLSGLGKIKGISGGAIMGDGRISLILDIPGLIELAQT